VAASYENPVKAALEKKKGILHSRRRCRTIPFWFLHDTRETIPGIGALLRSAVRISLRPGDLKISQKWLHPEIIHIYRLIPGFGGMTVSFASKNNDICHL
jgi:hypothetical protein